jgi:uncharacterized protein YbjT (DUF2867 family)
MADALDADEVLHFRSKFEIERLIRQSGLPHTLLGTVWFMDNLHDPKMGGEMNFPVIAGTLGWDRPFEMMAVEDIGKLASAIFAAPDEYAGRKINVAGDRLTLRAMRTVFRERIGRWPPGFKIPNFVTRFLNHDFAAQLRWQARIGWDFPLSAARDLCPSMIDFPTFLDTRQEIFARRGRASRAGAAGGERS